MNKFFALIVVAELALTGTAARAEGWTGSLGLSSDYRLRGISYSDRRATATLDASYRLDTGWAFGAGLATLDRDAERRRLLLSASINRAWQFDADWSGELGLAHSHYTGSARRRAYNTDEFSATLLWRGRFSASLMATPRFGRIDDGGQLRIGRAFGAEFGLRQPLFDALAFDAGLGYLETEAGGHRGYGYGNVGLAWAHGPAQLFLNYIASQARERRFAGAARAADGWVASVLWEF